ncbi:MAG TPA: hypothetical protein VHZ24_00725 [Pirellulales bacterium]|jgi:hypothetical protein|nr:hypothetical protein [Pirellulales bacterium]
MISAGAPRYEWKRNEDGASRSVAEAVQIASRWGVEIPHYVEFHVAPPGFLDPSTYARTTRFREFDGTIIQWEAFFHRLTGKIPFLVRADVFASDEAIVAVFGHEMYELETLRTMFDSNHSIEDWEAETASNNEGNVHWQAWDVADRLVEKMRTSK